jgi:ubiquinone/menaquinone biosynthesis C-methylase UbiE/uncharacterized protein YbaR (Trm112 family)
MNQLPDFLCRLLVCTICRGDLQVARQDALLCRVCGRSYPVDQGVARMLPEELAADVPAAERAEVARKRAEMRARDEQVDRYDRMWHLNLFGRVEVPATLRMLDLRSTDILLEAGCGTGRMSVAFANRCRHLIAADYSWESLRVCAAKLAGAGITNAALVQADICRLPFRDGVFDRIVSCQVLEHVPTSESRCAAVEELARVAAPHAVMALSAYKYSLLMRLFGQREGEHGGGIYFRRFTYAELRELLGQAWRVRRMTGALVYHYLAQCAEPCTARRTEAVRGGAVVQ